MSSTIIENVLRHCTNDPGEAVGYFYFNFRESQKQMSEPMVKSLVTQFSQQCIKFPRKLDSIIAPSGSPSSEALLDILRQIIEDLPTTYIILDALDECTDRTELMRTIETIAGWQVKSLHFLATSRRERDIESSLDCIIKEPNIVPLQRKDVDKDIYKYVCHSLANHKELKKWQKNPEMCALVQDKLMKGAHGMQVYSLFDCNHDNSGT